MLFPALSLVAFRGIGEEAHPCCRTALWILRRR